MLKLRSWDKWQGRGIADVRRMRETRGTSPDRPYAMGYVILATALDEDFRAFAEIVGGKVAETYFVRVVQYAGLNAAFSGEVKVRRALFGPVVLTREWDVVSAAAGQRVYDALISSGLAEPLSEARSERRSEQRPEQVAHASRSRVLSCPDVSCPDETPPVLSRRDESRTTGVPSASPPGTNGNGHDPPKPRMPTAGQIAGARAVVAVLLQGRDVDQDRRADARRVGKALDAGTATAEEVEAFARRHFQDVACRVAYTSPPERSAQR